VVRWYGGFVEYALIRSLRFSDESVRLFITPDFDYSRSGSFRVGVPIETDLV
jgi:hypothetical protein